VLRRPAPLLLLLPLAGCATSFHPRAPSVADRAARDPRAFVRAVAALRGIDPGPDAGAIPIVALDAPSFAERYLASHPAPAAREAERLAAFAVAFGFLPASAIGETLAAPAEVVPTGFYDPARRTVLLEADDQHPYALEVAVHEVVHALQHLRFGLPDLAAIADDDARAAARAMLEADAELSAWLFALRLFGEPDERSLRVAAGAERGRLVGVRGGELERFVYLDGLAFAAELYRAGGFALIDRALRAAPTTTEQVLHPAKYLAGERAIPVERPPPDAGERPILAGTLGEAGVRAMLRNGLPLDEAGRAASGWGGDAWSISEGTDGGSHDRGPRPLILRWVTAWDDEPSAARFERAVLAIANGHKGESTIAASPRWRLEGPPQVRREGARVAVIRGLPANELDERSWSRLLALVGAPLPPSPPLGPVAVPPPAHADSFWGTVDVRRWSSEWLGLAADAPAGRWRAELGVPWASGELSIGSAETTHAWARLFIAPPERIAALVDGAGSVLGELGVSEDRVRPLPQRHARLAGLHARSRTWLEWGGDHGVRSVVARLCHGRRALVVIAAWSNEETRAALDGFIASLHRTTNDPQSCHDLPNSPL